MGKLEVQFLGRAHAAAAKAGHLFPEYAASEAALESGWGRSQLAVLANNLFGQKAPPHVVSAETSLVHSQGASSVSLPTREFVHDEWVVLDALWMKFPDWVTCFGERISVLERLAASFPHYRAALEAPDGEVFVREVSQSWSTDPDRASKVLAIHDLYRSTFAAAL